MGVGRAPARADLEYESGYLEMIIRGTRIKGRHSGASHQAHLRARLFRILLIRGRAC
jgi:hypothetical protein